MKLFLVTIAIASPLCLHFAIVWQSTALMRLFLVLVALVVLVVPVGRHRIHGLVVAGLVALAGFVVDVAWFSRIAPLWAVAVFGSLALVFGRTLFGGRVPLCHRIAVLEHGDGLAPELVPYTRGVTLAWTALFVVLAMSALVLERLASPATVSFFTNVVSWLALAGLFAGEYAIRVRRFPRMQHINPLRLAFKLMFQAPQLLR